MKKLIVLSTLILATFVSVCGQTDILIDDFENGAISFADEININPPAHMTATVVANPVSDQVNSSNFVWKWERYDAQSSNQPWAGFWANLNQSIVAGYHRIQVKYLRTNSTSQIRLKVEGSAGVKEIDPIQPATLTNQWEVIEFDIHANGVKAINVISFFPDYYTPVNPQAITYIDDIKVIFDPNIVETTLDTIYHFTNSTSDRFYDQSWVAQTAPSTVATEHWQEGGVDGDKLPVVTMPAQEGNALKLQWKSAQGGDWMALVAALNWAVADASQMTHVEFWINSQSSINNNDLPKLFMEATSGNPNKTGSVLLSNYVNGTLPTNAWTKISIPLSDLWNADLNFDSKDLIKGLFFAQNLADNATHTIFLDNIIFVNKGTSSVESPELTNLDAYYSEGRLYLSDNVTLISIFDVNGRSILINQYIEDKTLNIQLNSGIYLVKTNLGSKKLIVT